VSATPAPRPRKPWYEARPERRAWELAEFASRDLPTKEHVKAGNPLVIETSLPFKGEEIAIRVAFPFDYPDVEPTIYGPENLLGRHQNRRHGNFCVLEEPAADWWPGMAAAQLVDEDVRWLLEDSETGPLAVRAGEADMPEPLSQHISWSGEIVLVPEPFWPLEVEATEGAMLLVEKRFGGQMLSWAEGIGEADEGLLDRFSASKPAPQKGRWAALDEGALSPWPSRAEVLEAAEAASPTLLGRLKRALRQDRKRKEAKGWVGVTFPEEGPKRGERRRGWTFLQVGLKRDGKREVLKVARAQAFTAAERERRTPELVGLSEARVLLVGAGSIGAPIAMELIKAGIGHLDVADVDRYDANNAVRHVLGVGWAGSEKEIGVAVEGSDLNPFVTVKPHHLEVGGDSGHSERLDVLMRSADVVVDATGSQVAARVLQRRCREFGAPMVLAALTAGSFGGEVAVFRPEGPCYYCFVLGQADGSIPKPSEGPRSTTTPVACSTPAFSGAGFDATALAALAARITVQASGKSSYPELDHDYVIVNFRGADPWQQGELKTHPGCPLCA
jgi:molybdopterin/thiamine biosynthesis adenylyltransferase